MSPASGPFRTLCGASIAYGLTNGGCNASRIEITELGRRIVRPTHEGEDLVAKREALLAPRVPGKFLRKYDNSPIPKVEIAANVLEEMSVPRERAAKVLELILDGARSLGLIKVIKDREYVSLEPTDDTGASEVPPEEKESKGEGGEVETASTERGEKEDTPRGSSLELRKKRVFRCPRQEYNISGADKETVSVWRTPAGDIHGTTDCVPAGAGQGLDGHAQLWRGNNPRLTETAYFWTRRRTSTSYSTRTYSSKSGPQWYSTEGGSYFS